MQHRFENHYVDIDSQFDNFEGFESFRLLKPRKGDTYMILVGFDSNELYEDFTKSSFYAEYFSKRLLVNSLALNNIQQQIIQSIGIDLKKMKKQKMKKHNYKIKRRNDSH